MVIKQKIFRKRKCIVLNKKTTGEKIFSALNVLFMVLIILVSLYPIYHVLMASFSEATGLMAHRGLLFRPIGFSTFAYKKVINNPMILTGFRNTLIVLVVGTVMNMFLTLCGGYFLSRKNVLWRNHIMILITITMYFSGGIVPFYLVVKSLHMDNTIWAMIIPSVMSTYNLIIMRTGFQGIPDGLEEAARIDGAGHMTVLFRICVPVIMPTIAVLFLYFAVGTWNSWFYASIFMKTRELFPLQLVLREILILSDTSSVSSSVNMGDVESLTTTIKYAAIIISTVPILCIYPFLQRFFEKGIMVGSLKG